MNVTLNRDIDKVIVLGSGESILELSHEEIDHINRCKMVISINKFMAFYKEAGIIPTHVYFVDRNYNGLLIVNYILKMCEADDLQGLVFIFHKSLKLRVYRTWIKKFFNQIVLFFYYGLRFLRRFRKELLNEMVDTRKFLKISKNHTYQYITHTLSTKGKVWRKSLKHKLFHYRGSLTTVLNYVSIVSPQTDIYLVGTDFYGATYFYEKELEELNIDWKDWTYEVVKERKKHFSFHDYKGVKMTDKFPFIIKCLEESDNKLFCINKKSLLVTEANVTYKELMDTAR